MKDNRERILVIRVGKVSVSFVMRYGCAGGVRTGRSLRMWGGTVVRKTRLDAVTSICSASSSCDFSLMAPCLSQ
jgi:hypothetical protein